MKLLNVIQSALAERGYDGLYNIDAECACLANDLAPCDMPSLDCRLGHRAPCDCGDHDFHVGPKVPLMDESSNASMRNKALDEAVEICTQAVRNADPSRYPADALVLDVIKGIVVQIQSRKGAQNAAYGCPRCGSRMIMRTRQTDAHGFYGCANYPRCRGTRNLDGTPSRGAHPDPHGNMDDALGDSGLDNDGWGAD